MTRRFAARAVMAAATIAAIAGIGASLDPFDDSFLSCLGRGSVVAGAALAYAWAMRELAGEAEEGEPA